MAKEMHKIKLMSWKNNKNYVYLLPLLAIGIGSTYFLQPGGPPMVDGKYLVELREDGFYPKDLKIKKGETVKFVSMRSEPFWPASNSHPLHLAYPEFDPQKPVEASDSWEFTFNLTGEWLYHDHMSAYMVGRIVVGEGDSSGLDCDDLKSLSVEKREQCWEKILNDTLLKKGVKEAFKTFTDFYTSDPYFVSTSCHQHAHKIGDFAYAEFRKHNDLTKLDIPPETVYCNYGFFHGLIGHMIEDDPNPQVLFNACNYLEENYSKLIPEIRVTCYHGAGHGLVPEPRDPSLWGNMQAMIDPGLAICDRVSNQEPDVRQCLEGLFNVLAMWLWNQEYGLTPTPNDPFKFCGEQKKTSHTLACYYEFAMPLNRFVKNISDLPGVIDQYVSKIADSNTAKLVTNSLVAGSVTQALVQENLENYIPTCRSLKQELRESCFIGITGGLVAHGHPGHEHIKAFEFCGSGQMSETERQTCYKYLFNAFQWVYNQGKIQELCALIPSQYQSYCQGLKQNE